MFPAYDAIAKDIGLGFARWRVYMALQPPVLNFVTPQPVKVIGLAADLRMRQITVKRALDWLTANGYVIELGRDGRGVRSLLLAWAVAQREDVARAGSVIAFVTNVIPG